MAGPIPEEELRRKVPPWPGKPSPAVHGQNGNGKSEEKPDFSKYDWARPKKLKDATRKMPAELIRGLLYQSRRFIVTGESKSRKSWFLHQLLFCIANGLAFLGFETVATVVLYVNMELLEGGSSQRFDAIQEAIGQGTQDNIHVISAAMYLDKIGPDFPAFLASVSTEINSKCVVIDPIWRLFLGLEENSNSDVCRLMAPMAAIARESGASMGASHHHAKGPAGLKNAIDRASGAGAFMRDPALIITMTPHREEDAYILNIRCSDFPKVDPFCVRFVHPLFVRADDLDPNDLQPLPGKGRPVDLHTEKMLAALRAADVEGGLTHRDWLKASGVAKPTFSRKLRDLTKKGGKVVKSVLNGKYTLSPDYAEDLRDAEDYDREVST